MVRGGATLHSTSSPENPLLSLTAQEFLTLKRCGAAVLCCAVAVCRWGRGAVPGRFTEQPGGSGPGQRELCVPRQPPPSQPAFRTSYSAYGEYPPSRHTAPHTYHGLDTSFTARATRHGMFRNHSVNI